MLAVTTNRIKRVEERFVVRGHREALAGNTTIAGTKTQHTTINAGEMNNTKLPHKVLNMWQLPIAAADKPFYGDFASSHMSKGCNLLEVIPNGLKELTVRKDSLGGTTPLCKVLGSSD